MKQNFHTKKIISFVKNFVSFFTTTIHIYLNGFFFSYNYFCSYYYCFINICKCSNETCSKKLKLSCMHHIFCKVVHTFIYKFIKISISIHHRKKIYIYIYISVYITEYTTKFYDKIVFHVSLLNIQSNSQVVYTHLIMTHFMESDNIGVALTGSQQVYFICAVNLSTNNFNCKFLSCLSVYAFTAH